jgi:hypothetical protein
MNNLEQLKQCLKVIWDGNLISKSSVEELRKSGLVERGYGFTWITRRGIKILIDMGELKRA